MYAGGFGGLAPLRALDGVLEVWDMQRTGRKLVFVDGMTRWWIWRRSEVRLAQPDSTQNLM
jgi:hypothetical protein